MAGCCRTAPGRWLLAVSVLVAAVAALVPAAAQEPLRVRRNFFGSHNLKDGGPDYRIGMDWTAEMNGAGFVFDWVFDPIPWVEAAFQRNLIPCIRVQECNGGCSPSAWYAGNMASTICNYKLQHPQYADRIVYFQLWNEPGDSRDEVSPPAFADYLVAAYNAVHSAEAAAAAQNPAIAGTMLCMTPGQNGPAWWQEAFAHNPAAKNAFDVWGTHPYPESNPPWYNHHEGAPTDNAVKTIDSYLLDLDKLAESHGGISRIGFPVMITETCYGDHLGISFEGYPKTTRQLAADYYVMAYRDFWYKWPEIRAVHPYILSNIKWDAFAMVNWQSGTTDSDHDGLTEPTAPYPQYAAVRQLRESLQAQGKLAAARISPYRGARGAIEGTITRSDNGQPVKYVSVYTDGYEFGGVSVFNGKYAIRDVPVGTYTLACHKNGYQDSSRQITVTSGGTVTANFSLLYTGKDPHQFYFVSSAQGPCSGCSLFATSLGQTFRTPSDVGYMKFFAAMPNVGNVDLKFTLIDGDNPNGTVLGTFNSYHLETGGEMIGGEAVGDGIPVQPNHTYFLKIERTDGQGVYLYASGLNPYPDGCAWVGGTRQPGWDLYGCYRGNRVAVITDVGAIAGNVRNASGQNLSGASVTTSPGGYSAVTDPGGNYTIANVPVGTYGVTASKAGYVLAMQAGQAVTKDQTTMVNFVLAPAPVGTIAGNVKNASGQNLSGAAVTTSPGGYSATTDSNGNYTIAAINTGTYDVTASKQGYASQIRAGQVVNQNQTTTVNFGLANAAPFAGLLNGSFEGGSYNSPDGDHAVANNWQKFVVSGSPKYNVPWLTTWHGGNYGQSFYESGWVMGICQQVANATVGHNYAASVWVRGSNATPRFWVGIDPLGGTDPASNSVQWSPESIPGTAWTQINKQAPAQANTVTVFIKAQNASGINYAYIDDAALAESAPSPGTIIGYVRDTANAPLAGASVTAGSYSSTSAANGSYTITGVAAGTYDVVASKPGYQTQTQAGKQVASGGTATADFSLLDASAPTTPAVTDGGAYTTSTTQLFASWSASDSQSGITEYSYAIGTTPGWADIAGWTSAGTSTSVTKTGLSLSYNDDYYVSVKAANRDALWSEVGHSSGITVARPLASVSQAKTYPDGAAVNLAARPVTAARASAFWIEDPSRAAGIRVAAPNSLAVGAAVTSVSGVLSTVNGERVLNLAEFSAQGTAAVPGALGVSGLAAGGSNVGLLVRVWGVVKGTGAGCFYIDDGSHRADFAGETGLKVDSPILVEPPTEGDFVVVTGVVTMENTGSRNVPVVAIRAPADVVTL